MKARDARWRAPDGSRPALSVFVALVGLYVASLAPDVTLWDAGEFNSAIATLGIPHPPGTPLYILLGRVWSRLLGFVPQALALNALSAVASAAGCAGLAFLISRWSRSGSAGLAAGIGAGVTYSLWQNATETEVYALSFLLAILCLVIASRAGESGQARHRALLVYGLALAVPLQISALAAAPAAIYLAATPSARSRPVPGRLLSLGGAFLVVIGVGLVHPLPLIAGLGALVSAALLPERWRAGDGNAELLPLSLLAVVGASAALFMWLRAPFDPGVNQGNPATWQHFVDVVARRQYDVPPLWPRRAPWWIQIGNVVQYADWQIAFGLSNDVGPSWLRTPWSLLFGALSAAGGRLHWQRDRRSAAAMTLLLLSASLGVALVLNLRAGPSIGVGVLPPGAAHEPREREYFFALAFGVAGAWAGLGAAHLAARRLGSRRAWLGVAAAGLPVLLNWGAANRRRQPDASLAVALGTALLESSPPRSVLLLAGDNDTYATWYQQRVHKRRTDVTPITLPLLGAQWYRAELARRDSLIAPSAIAAWAGEEATLRDIAAMAQRRQRPIAAAVSVEAGRRRLVARAWEQRGMVHVVDTGAATSGRAPSDRVDAVWTARIVELIRGLVPRLDREPRDPAGRYVATLLRCPSAALLSDTATSGMNRC